MGTMAAADRGFYLAQRRNTRRQRQRPFELYDFFLEKTDESLELAKITASRDPQKKKRFLQDFITELSAKQISEFGQRLATAPPAVISRVMIRLPQLATQYSSMPNYQLLASTIVAKVPPKQQHESSVATAAALCPAVRESISVGFFSRVWNIITGASSWNDFPQVKSAVSNAYQPVPWYKQLFQAIFANTANNQEVGSRFSQASSPPTSIASDLSLPGSRFSDPVRAHDLPGSVFSPNKQGARPPAVASDSNANLPGSQFNNPAASANDLPGSEFEANRRATRLPLSPPTQESLTSDQEFQTPKRSLKRSPSSPKSDSPGSYVERETPSGSAARAVGEPSACGKRRRLDRSMWSPDGNPLENSPEKSPSHPSQLPGSTFNPGPRVASLLENRGVGFICNMDSRGSHNDLPGSPFCPQASH